MDTTRGTQSPCAQPRLEKFQGCELMTASYRKEASLSLLFLLYTTATQDQGPSHPDNTSGTYLVFYNSYGLTCRKKPFKNGAH